MKASKELALRNLPLRLRTCYPILNGLSGGENCFSGATLGPHIFDLI